MAREWMPPAVLRWLRKGRKGGIQFEGDYSNWEDADAQCTGYDSEEVLARVLESTLKIKRGEGAYERDSVVFEKADYAWPVLAGLMWAAASAGGRLNVLDFGGALGSSYFQYGKLLRRVPDVRWNIVEQEHYVRAGQRHVETKQLRFYPSIEDCQLECRPNLILMSSVLQYLRDPAQAIRAIAGVGAAYLLVDRTPFIDQEADRLVVQRVPRSIYRASYPMWVFSSRKFMETLGADWSLVASHSSPEGVVSAPAFEFYFCGHTFEWKSCGG
jgi:putative methyltransferase (TIGR04325 family)